MRKNKERWRWKCVAVGVLGASVLIGGCKIRIPSEPSIQTTATEEAAIQETTTQETENQEAETQETTASTMEAEPIPAALPGRYDARADGRAPEVKDQGDLGTCWAFASLMALQSTLQPEQVWDFSEDHMSNNPNFTLSQKQGGEYTMSMAYLLSWQGPVREEEDPYGDGISPEGLEAAKHVQEIWMVPARDREGIKRAVYEQGGVQSSLYTNLVNKDSESIYYNKENGAYYCPDKQAPNHEIVIVGWDDDFPREAFETKPPSNGAYLCANSWGTQFGMDGFFYVSYYDVNMVGNGIVYKSVEDTDNYDYIYQSDLCGWIGQIGYGEDTAWATNVYQTAGKERLDAVGFYATDQDTAYEIYVVKDIPKKPEEQAFISRTLVAKGSVSYGGYYTIPLERTVVLEPEERYGVMMKITTPETIHPVAIEYDAGDGKSRIDLEDGEGYISLDGERWQHVEETQKCNICLKAYTTDAKE